MTSDADITDVGDMKQAVVEGLAAIGQIYAKATETALPHRIRVGKLLTQIKEHPSIKHGDWLPWLKSVGLGHRRAQEFMQLASKETLLKSKCADIALLTEQAAWEIVRDQTRTRKPLPDDHKPFQHDFGTSTSFWRLDDKEVRQADREWKGVTGEDGKSGVRANAGHEDSKFFSGTHALFSRPLAEALIGRYAGDGKRTILDPFAGGPTRGLLAAHMGHDYHGFDLSQKQIDYNQEVLAENGLTAQAHYYLGDARYLKGGLPVYDFALTSPPYYNVEVYSDLPADLSNLPTYADFNKAMRKVARAMRRRLKPGAFACMHVGNFRIDNEDELTDFRGDTVRNFQDAGFLLWDVIIVKTPNGSAAIRVGNAWKRKKLVRVHQYVLVFKVPDGTERRGKSTKRKARARKAR